MPPPSRIRVYACVYAYTGANFYNIAHDGSFQHCTWLYLALHDCARLYLALPWSAVIYLSTEYHILPLTGPNAFVYIGLNAQNLQVDGRITPGDPIPRAPAMLIRPYQNKYICHIWCGITEKIKLYKCSSAALTRWL